MGNNSGKKGFQTENQKIFDLLSDMHTKERLFKTFCAKFEYKLYKKPIDDKRYMITWREFENDMLNNFTDSEINYKSYIILETFRKYFHYHNDNLRIFKVYMIYFPLVLHLDGTEGLNFIELIFDKVIYNLEVEMKGNNKSYHIQEEKISTDETKTDRTEILANSIINDKSTSRKLLDSFIDKKNIERTNKVIKSEQLVNSIDHKLLTKFSEFYHGENDKKNKFVRTIPIKIFKEIMIVYFHSNITFFLRAFKDVIREFDPTRHEEDKLIDKMKYFHQDKIIYNDLSEENVEKFIDSTISNLIKRRDQLQTIEYDKISLNYDDIYVYYKFNSYFLNMFKTYQTFQNFINIKK